MSGVRVKPGDVLGGKYRVERILGAGGMGVVVAAKNLDLGTRVAIKFILKEAMNDDATVGRFMREARAAALLHSVHTARVIDTGKFKNGEHYIVMEYLEGKDLDGELRDKGPMPPHVAVDYILQACEALAEAHGMGMIHRDVKPKNLFLTTTISGKPLVKVLDFGLAKTIGNFNDVSLTATNSVFGSPQYMSPEQMRNAKEVDARSDIWSIGVCLYELLTGHVPFDGGGVAEICAMVLKDPPPLPSKFVRGIPPDLEATVCKCLEKDPMLRFQSVAELAVALEPYAAEEGSAKRILHVMEGAKRIDVPTMMTPGNELDDLGPKTMSAWGSGGPKLGGDARWFYSILAALLFLGITGVGFMVAVKYSKSRAAAAAAADSSGLVAVPLTAVEPPPPPTILDPVPIPAVDTAKPPAKPTAAKPTHAPPPPAPAPPKPPAAKPAPPPPVTTKPAAPTNDPGARP